MWEEVDCQRFFTTGSQSSFFRVTVPLAAVAAEQEAASRKGLGPCQRKSELLRALVDSELDKSAGKLKESAKVYLNQATETEVSPWLEMTRWPRYFDGLDLTKLIAESVDRVVEQAHASICEDRIGVFDQAKINSFVDGGGSVKAERMLMVKLQKRTFREYKSLWKQLLCFVCRTSQLGELSLLLSTDRTSWHSKQQVRAKTKKEIEADLDKVCLLLCVSLLDHNLRGSHFESAVLGFLAVVGIDGKEGGVFLGPCAYSPYLSKFIKIAQMLVIQRAVLTAEGGDMEYPSDMLDELRERFMIRGTRSAFDWAYRLRAYAKKVSEDKETVTYKDVELQMAGFKEFVAVQVQLAQKQLEELLLLHPEEKREEVVPTFYLHRLQDDYSNNKKGWNFLKDARNSDQL
ncbi:hypothetical protein H2201_003593 [Coniosporium apollinis]|uniref:Uncharacterized protein n=1 Tax=Coniosporium apollinis TaxID=61459 RepID=A0ABQ9NVH3_9PEZI|nr:hypothetical protein H2201_003593 [Coniosporium apollinis]